MNLVLNVEFGQPDRLFNEMDVHLKVFPAMKIKCYKNC